MDKGCAASSVGHAAQARARAQGDVLQVVRGRRRRSARREAQVRRRRFVALVVMVLAVIVALLVSGAVQARATAAPGAGALLASVAGDPVGGIFNAPSVAMDDASVSDSRASSDLRFSDGLATVRSSLIGAALVSESDVSLSRVDLLGGVVTADSVEVVATADAGPASAGAGLGECFVNGLEVNGKPVTDTSEPIEIPGVGTLTVLASTTEPGAPSPSAVVTGLTLTLDEPVGDLPAGAVIVAGSAVASADAATAHRLVRQAAAQSEPTPLPAPLPTATATAHPGKHASGGNDASSSGNGTTSSSGDRSTAAGSGSGTGGSVADSSMPVPAPPRKEILARFPGAVFPVKGAVSYTDTFGAYRADMPAHRHEGNDIFARQGTPIVAVLAGTIRYSTTGIGGNNAHLTDARGDYFYYAHMVRFAAGLHSGDHVERGQVIGYVGETGDAAGTSPHCHFEIHPDGGPAVDPYPYLEAWRASADGIGAQDAVPVATLVQAGAGITLAELLARRGVLVGVALGAEVVGGRRAVAPPGLPHPDLLELVLFASSLGGVAAIKRLRAPEIPELLAAHETVVRRTVVVATRPLTKS